MNVIPSVNVYNFTNFLWLGSSYMLAAEEADASKVRLRVILSKDFPGSDPIETQPIEM